MMNSCFTTKKTRRAVAHLRLAWSVLLVPLLLVSVPAYSQTFDSGSDDSDGALNLTEPGTMTRAATRTIERRMGHTPELSTSGGTSDGRFIAPTGAQVLELGPCNATIHKVDEHVELLDLVQLTDIYEGLLLELLPA